MNGGVEQTEVEGWGRRGREEMGKGKDELWRILLGSAYRNTAIGLKVINEKPGKSKTDDGEKITEILLVSVNL